MKWKLAEVDGTPFALATATSGALSVGTSGCSGTGSSMGAASSGGLREDCVRSKNRTSSEDKHEDDEFAFTLKMCHELTGNSLEVALSRQKTTD